MRGLAYLAANRRPLPLALAHWSARERPGSPRWTVANRLYNRFSLAGQIAYRAELLECRAAKRGERLAQISQGGVA
jgi:hypothetical protein